MKIAFCCAEDLSLGAGYIISFLKSQGHEVRLFFDPLQFRRGYARNRILHKIFTIENYNVRQITRFRPDICCFNCVTATYQWALRMAKKVKEKVSCKIIFGGVHPTLVPEVVKQNNFIDEVVAGDGIEYFGGKFDPDKIWPDREIFLRELPPEHRKIQLFMTSFGCSFNCSFCGNEQLRKVGRYKFTRRTVKGCIDELTYLKGKGAKYILFVDDIFTCDSDWLSNFLSAYTGAIDLPFACFIHPKFVNEKIAEMLKEAGCHTAWMGIQTGNEILRKEILNRPETNTEIINAAKLIKSKGIKLIVDHIFGIPFENNLSQDISHMLYQEIKADIVNCYQLLYFPKAKIIEHAIHFGYLNIEEVNKIERGEGINYQMNNRGQYYYDIYAKAMVTIPLDNILWELLPISLIKLIIYIRAGRGFIPLVMIQNELFFTWRMILKKMRLYRGA